MTHPSRARILFLLTPLVMIAACTRVGTTQWSAFQTTPPGTEIKVRVVEGSSVKGEFQGATDDRLRVVTESGAQVQVARDDVLEVAPAGPDSLVNGLLIGAGLGVGGGAIAKAEGGREAFWATFGWTTGLGVLIDWLSRDVLYRPE